MRLSRYLFSTTKEAPAETEFVSHRLMLRAGLIKQVTSGIYSFLPLGFRVLDKVVSVVRDEMNAVGAQEFLLPFVQPAELWKISGRWDEYGEELLRFQDRKGNWLVLSPTHEEIVTDLAKEILTSYRRLPVVVYQIQIKFRDELRPRGGIIRSREFLMKDAYSFCKDEAQMKEIYQEMRGAYERIFTRCGLEYKLVEAESGLIGGDISHEFITPASAGEDKIVECESCGYCSKLEKANSVVEENEGVSEGCLGEVETPNTKPMESLISPKDKCSVCHAPLRIKRGLEVGHLFHLGYKYSSKLGALFSNEEGEKNPLLMGCYGVGISRIPAAIIEQNNDEDGIIWPKEVAPFKAVVIPTSEQTFDFSEKVYQELKGNSIDVLWDDRDTSAGVKFKDSDLMGIPLKVIIGRTFLKEGKIEVKKRKNGELIKIDKGEFIQQFMGLM
ncbi:proline--tRNA ligase [Candidatus Aerophobetes bacterium]|nr:proline--tRNA ligase [Candidatus Aerophobetes bacterium]